MEGQGGVERPSHQKTKSKAHIHVFACTERQAANLGRFLNESLSVLMHWKSSEELYATDS